MSMVPVKSVGQYGVNRDLSAPELPINVWTDCQNIRFLDGYASQFYGHAEVFASPSVVPYHVLPVTLLGVNYWMYASNAKIYITGASGTHTNITRQTASVDVNYSAVKNGWVSTVLGGIPILNNGVDAPQYWPLSLASKCADLTNWPANTTCAVMRSFKNMLVAMDVTKAGTRYPYMVKISHPADPGTIPVTWDVTDATKDALEYDISSGYGYIIDGLELRGSFMIYKTDGCFRMDYTGGAFLVSNQKVLGMSGAMNKNCITEIDGMHFVLTGFDVVVHDGNQATSVLDKQTRRTLFQSIDSQLQNLCFVFKNPYLNEVFVCYPEPGQTTCNKAMVWNWKDKTISFRDLPSVNHAAYGALDTGLSQTWDSDSGTWDTDLTSWNQGEYTPGLARVLMGSDDTKLYQLDTSATFNGATISAYLERSGLHFDAPDKIKTVKGIRPRITGTNGGTVMVSVGSSNDAYASPSYGTPVAYTIGSSVTADLFQTGRYMAVKFSSGTALQWRLDSYDIDVMTGGSWSGRQQAACCAIPRNKSPKRRRNCHAICVMN